VSNSGKRGRRHGYVDVKPQGLWNASGRSADEGKGPAADMRKWHDIRLARNGVCRDAIGGRPCFRCRREQEERDVVERSARELRAGVVPEYLESSRPIFVPTLSAFEETP
jgi:hypothetical protein